jgi:hypothetical protein
MSPSKKNDEPSFKLQEKKMELYQAIVKFEEGKLDDSIVKVSQTCYLVD